MSSNPAAIQQPAPTGDGQEVLPHVLDDLFRANVGNGRYESAHILARFMCSKLNGREGALFANSTTEKLKADLAARQEAGIAKYGTPLKTNNGRDALMDAYQESLDLLMYLKQWMMEQNCQHVK